MCSVLDLNVQLIVCEDFIVVAESCHVASISQTVHIEVPVLSQLLACYQSESYFLEPI